MAVALLCIACGHGSDRIGAHDDAGRRGARIDSSGARATVEGIAPPSATLGRRSRAADSAAALDRAFQALRQTINAEAHALDTLPVSARHTAVYGQRFDTLRRLTLQADTLRAARDRERAKARRNTSGAGTRRHPDR